ncbi:MAG: metal ABC transporter substrate-binding protein [Bacilli bacterium]
MKKIINVLLILAISLSVTGCFKSDTMEDITIYTTVYPIEFITAKLYGDYGTVKSIYPDGVMTQEYSLTKKQIKDYSDSELFIFNGLNNEKEYVSKFFEKNSKIKIIDSTSSMEVLNRTEELWLNPSNLLMIAQNIKNGFSEYVNNHYIINTIEQNYEDLKIEISNLDASISLIVENSNSKTIIVSDDLFNFLSKFGFNVISLDQDTTTEKAIATAKELLTNGECNFIFAPNNEELNESVKKVVSATNAKISYLHTLSNITETERNNNKDYITIMKENIEAIKNEIYN